MRYALFLFFGLVGCGGKSIDDHPCPPGNTLNYQNFGRRFFTEYCVSCHGGSAGYSSLSFTTHESIRQHRERIFENATGDNPPMPPGPDDPPEADRRALADWLACEAK